jgi:hypothetical protein
LVFGVLRVGNRAHANRLSDAKRKAPNLKCKMQNAKRPSSIANRSQDLLSIFFHSNCRDLGFVNFVRPCRSFSVEAQTLYFNRMRQKSDCAVELPSDSPTDSGNGSSRRDFITRLAAISASLTIASPLLRSASAAEQSKSKSGLSKTGEGERSTQITLKVNGNTEQLLVDSRVTLVGTGMATALYPAHRSRASPKVPEEEKYAFNSFGAQFCKLK